MSNTLTITLLVLGGLVAFGATAEARSPRRCRAASTSNVAQSTDGGYRTYSYEPGVMPGASPRYSSPESRPFSGFHSAGWKITGR